MCDICFASLNDTQAILEMMRDYYSEDDYPFVPEEARRAILALMNEENLGRLWVILDGEKVVGYSAVTFGFSLVYRGRDAFLDELFILPSHRGRGLGTQAIRVAEELCRQVGVNALHLEVEPHRERAIDLYRREGFQDNRRHLLTKWLRDEH